MNNTDNKIVSVYDLMLKEMKKQTKLLEEILNELREEELPEEPVVKDDIPELWESEKRRGLISVVKNGYKYTFSNGIFIKKEKANVIDWYMYRNVDEGEEK